MAEELEGAGPIRSFVYRHAPARVQEWMQDHAMIERVTKALDDDAMSRNAAVEAPAQKPSAFETVRLPPSNEPDNVPIWLREYNRRTGIGTRGSEVHIPDPPTPMAQPSLAFEVTEVRHEDLMRKLLEPDPTNVVEFKGPVRDERQHSWDWGR